MKSPKWLLKFFEAVLPARRLIIIEGDAPPKKLPWRNIVLAREDGEDWAVGFMCPCGCGKQLELLLIEEARPNWSLDMGVNNRPTLHPSVWLKSGCQSHFWVKSGKIVWC